MLKGKDKKNLLINNFKMDKMGFGGSCHWCTEAIFLSISGVLKVDQGWVSPSRDIIAFSEAIIVEFNTEIISIKDLITVHLHSHSCTSEHSMRAKYRSAIYLMNPNQEPAVHEAIFENQKNFEEKIITEVVLFGAFKMNSENYLNYYFKDPEKPFCENVIYPKLKKLISDFNHLVDHQQVSHLL